MGKSKKRKKPKAKQAKKTKQPKARPAALPPSSAEPTPSGPNLDDGPYMGPRGPAVPERKAWHILALVAVGGAAVLGLAAYNQITQHTEVTEEDRLFDQRKADVEARKKREADAAGVRSDTPASEAD